MISPLSALSDLNTVAYLSGLFNWQIENASYTNPDGSTVSFHVLNNVQIPIERYVEGAINTFNLVGYDLTSSNNSNPNTGLFNTFLTAENSREEIGRKYVRNKIPYANYDILGDLGVGGQTIAMDVIFCGTMYLQAMLNIIQVLFNNKKSGNGILNHPFYNEIKNVLPLSMAIRYTATELNCVRCQLTFATSNIDHLNPANNKLNILSEIGKWYIGVQNAITSIAGIVSVLETNLVKPFV